MTTLRVRYPLPVRELLDDAGDARTIRVPPDPELFAEFAGVRLDMDDGLEIAALITSGKETAALRLDAGLTGGAFIARRQSAPDALACDLEFTVTRRLTQGELERLLQALSGYVDHAVSSGQGFALELDNGRVFFLEPDTTAPDVQYE